MTETLIDRPEIAHVLHFPPAIACYVDWPSIARTARDLGAHFKATNGDDGSWTVIFFWAVEGA